MAERRPQGRLRVSLASSAPAAADPGGPARSGFSIERNRRGRGRGAIQGFQRRGRVRPGREPFPLGRIHVGRRLAVLFDRAVGIFRRLDLDAGDTLATCLITWASVQPGSPVVMAKTSTRCTFAGRELSTLAAGTVNCGSTVVPRQLGGEIGRRRGQPPPAAAAAVPFLPQSHCRQRRREDGRESPPVRASSTPGRSKTATAGQEPVRHKNVSIERSSFLAMSASIFGRRRPRRS